MNKRKQTNDPLYRTNETYLLRWRSTWKEQEDKQLILFATSFSSARILKLKFLGSIADTYAFKLAIKMIFRLVWMLLADLHFANRWSCQPIHRSVNFVPLMIHASLFEKHRIVVCKLLCSQSVFSEFFCLPRCKVLEPTPAYRFFNFSM